MILYHVTKERFVKKILRQGLRPQNIPRLEYGKTTKKYVFLTDRKGIRTIVDHWVGCYGKGRNAIILKVKVPTAWLDTTKKRMITYDNPYAAEYRVARVIPPSQIIDVITACKDE